jgi:hypothetical protein
MFKNKKLNVLIVAIFIISIGILLAVLPVLGEEKLPGGLVNPLGTTNIPQLIGRIIKAILGIIGSIAFLMFIYGGFLWMTAGGSPEAVKKGKETLIWATIGLATIFFAYAAVSFVINAITSGAGGGAAPQAGEEGAMACDCIMELEEKQLVTRTFRESPFGTSCDNFITSGTPDCVAMFGAGFTPDECSEGSYTCKKEDWVSQPQTARVSGSDQDDISNRCLELCDENARIKGSDWRCAGNRLLPDTCALTQ